MILKFYDNFIVQGILISILETSLNGTNFFDIFYPVGFDIPHAKNVCLKEDKAANTLIENCSLNEGRLHKYESQN